MKADLLLSCYWVVIDWSCTDGEWYSVGDNIDILNISDDNNRILG
jgi:hypothetical protein